MKAAQSGQKSSGGDDTYRHMSTDVVSSICKAKGGFRTPDLNEQLYLHFGGFAKIEGLDEFVNCRVLWLENNCLSLIENLEPLQALSALYLQNNCLRSLGTCPIPSLRSLNVCHNNLTTLEGLQYMPNLEKLLASHNNIVDIAALSHTLQLTVLDLSYNKLQGADGVSDTLKKLSALASLMLHGNDVVREVKNYREAMVVQHAGLKFLDEYPVFDDERRCCVAFWQDGEGGRKAEREKIRQEEKHRQEEQRAFFAKFIDDAKAKRAEEKGAPLPVTDYYEKMSRVVDADPLEGRQPAADIMDDDDDEDVYVPCKVVSGAVPSGKKHVDPFGDASLVSHNRGGGGAAYDAPEEEVPCVDIVSINTIPPSWRKEVYQVPFHSEAPPTRSQLMTEEEVLDGFRSLIPTALVEALERLSTAKKV